MNYRDPSRVLTIRFGISHANLFLNGYSRGSLLFLSLTRLTLCTQFSSDDTGFNDVTVLQMYCHSKGSLVIFI